MQMISTCGDPDRGRSLFTAQTVLSVRRLNRQQNDKPKVNVGRQVWREGGGRRHKEQGDGGFVVPLGFIMTSHT